MVGISLKRLPRPHPATLAFALLFLAFVLTFGWMAWAGNRAFMRILRDTDVAMWHWLMKHVVRGELPLLRNPWSGTYTHYFAADHFDPLTFLVAPFWMLLPTNVIFAWIQIAVYAGAAALLFAVAKVRLASAAWGCLIASAFLLSPVPTWSLYNHFNSSPFVILFVPWAVSCLLCQKTWWYWVAIAGLLFSREDAAVLAGAVGLYAALVHRRYWLGGLTVLIAGAYLVTVIRVVIPYFAAGFQYPYIANGYGWLGQTPLQVVSRLFGDPVWVVRQLSAMGAVRGLMLHLLPFALTPLVSWRGLVFLVPLSYLLLHEEYRQLNYHHAYRAAILAGLAAVEGVRQLRGSLLPRLPGRVGEAALAGAILAFAVGTHVWAGYSPASRSFTWAEFTAGPRERAMQTALALVPPGSRVTASRVLLTHLVPRHDLECVWERVEAATEPQADGLWCPDTNAAVQAEYLLIVEPRDSPKMRALLSSGRYDVRFFQNDVVLFQRGAPGTHNRALAHYVFHVRQARDLAREVGKVAADDLAWDGYAVTTERRQQGLALYGWYRWVCPGLYQVTLRARAAPGADDIGRLEVVSEAGTTGVAVRPLRGRDLPGDHYDYISLPFMVAEKREVEIRVQTTGRTTLWLDEVSLEPLDTRPRPLVPPEDPPC